MILILYAFRRELGALRRRLTERAPLGGGMRGIRARLGGEEVALVATGIGAVRARALTRQAIAGLSRPTLIISCGVAGALSAGLKAGDIVLADRLILGGPNHLSEHTIATAPTLIRTVESALRRKRISFATGPLLTASRVLSGRAVKSHAKAQSGAIAVDMESAAIALEAAAADLPMVCIRAVMDEAGDELPGAELTNEMGEVPILKAAGFFLKNPGALATIPTMVRNLSRATAALADALEAVCTRSRT